MSSRWLLTLGLVFSLVLAGLAQPGHDHDHDHDHGHDHGQEYQQEKPAEDRVAKVGDFVEIHYDMWVDNGDGELHRSGPKKDIFLSATRAGKPFKLQIGQPGIIPGFSMALIGMKPGERKSSLIPPQLGYGGQDKGFDPKANLLLNVEMVSLRTDEEMQDLVEKEDDDHGHHSRANLPLIMEFMLKAFFKQPWMPRPEENPDPTGAVLWESAKIGFVLLMLALIGHFLQRRKSR